MEQLHIKVIIFSFGFLYMLDDADCELMSEKPDILWMVNRALVIKNLVKFENKAIIITTKAKRAGREGTGT